MSRLVQDDGRPTPGLVIDGLTVRFGGVIALEEVGLVAPGGRLTGLIGPNGAGKTTLFNACSGLTRPARGRVVLFGRDVTGLTPARRAQAGLGRTFQRLELCDSLTVAENVAFGCEARLAGSRPWSHVAGTPRDRADVNRRAGEALEWCGLDRLPERQVGSLSTGQRRLVELARVLAGGFPFVLLDEPSSGLDSRETEEFAVVLRRAVDERGIGGILVEHDVPLVMSLCAHVYVLDFGRLIFEGDPATVATSPVVRAAYLGAGAA